MRAALVLSAMLVASTASAASSELVTNAGTFVYGDGITALRVTLYEGAGRYNLTGKTVALIARTTINGRYYDIRVPGDLVTPASGVCRFPAVGAAGRNPGTRVRDTYNARVVVIAGSDSGFTSPLTFTVSRPLP